MIENKSLLVVDDPRRRHWCIAYSLHEAVKGVFGWKDKKLNEKHCYHNVSIVVETALLH